MPLGSGRGRLVGGNNQLTNETLADARVYDPAADTWTPTAPLARGRYSRAVVTLADGSVIVAELSSAPGGGTAAPLTLRQVGRDRPR